MCADSSRQALEKWPKQRRETLRVHAEMYTSYSKGIAALLEQGEKKRFLGGWRDAAVVKSVYCCRGLECGPQHLHSHQ